MAHGYGVESDGGTIEDDHAAHDIVAIAQGIESKTDRAFPALLVVQHGREVAQVVALLEAR